MAVIRKAALDSHAAAREVVRDNAARSAARAAGQAVATAHVPTHSIAAANYALQAHLRPRIMLLKSEHGNISIWLNYSEFRNQGVYSWTIKQGLLCSEYYEAS